MAEGGEDADYLHALKHFSKIADSETRELLATILLKNAAKKRSGNYFSIFVMLFNLFLEVSQI